MIARQDVVLVRDQSEVRDWTVSAFVGVCLSPDLDAVTMATAYSVTVRVRDYADQDEPHRAVRIGVEDLDAVVKLLVAARARLDVLGLLPIPKEVAA